MSDTLDIALGKASIDRCSYGFSASTMSIWKGVVENDAYKLPIYTPLHQALLRLPGYGRLTEDQLEAALDGTTPLSDAILVAAQRKGHEIDACLDYAEFAGAARDPSPLAAALALLREKNGQAADRPGLEAAVSALPGELQRALVPIIAALDHAAHEFSASLGTTEPASIEWLELVHGFLLPAVSSRFVVDQPHLQLLAGVDAARMARAAAVLARAVENAALSRFAGRALAAVNIDTPLGAVVLRGAEADRYEPGDAAEKSLLLLDTGGDDEYRVPVGAGRRDQPISIAIDLAGSDSWAYVEAPDASDSQSRQVSDAAGRNTDLSLFGQTLSRIGRQGSGVLGIGLLFDLGDEADNYRSLTLSQGSGSLGVGGLYDAGGDDHYFSEALSQGAALWGIGVLVDRSGKDEYRTFQLAQGFGYVQGVGLIADGAGDDVYFADPGDPAIGGDPLYPTPQLPGTGNTSFVQGAGFGRRDTRFTMGGGHGVLYDRGGNDHYTASVFGQATGYWLGFGMLIDAGGADAYEGLWYVQGSTAHFALSFFYERGGNDKYNEGFPVRATSIGVGHDFSGSLHLDEAGDDRYFAPGLSLGCGNSQGIGGVINIGGNDHYESSGTATLGCASFGHDPPYDTVRDVRPTVGLFVDSDGTDSYVVPAGGPAASDGASWAMPVSAGTAGAPATELSGGVDQSPGSAAVP